MISSDSGTLYVIANMSSFVALKENNNVHTRKKVRIYNTTVNDLKNALNDVHIYIVLPRQAK